MTNPNQRREVPPVVEYLDAADPERLAAYLRRRGWLDENRRLLGAERAGEGNMNYTLRVRTSGGTFILKQARPWVEKYPQIAAPVERAIVEGRFYQSIAALPRVAGAMPKLLGVDFDSKVLVLEDLGLSGDLTGLYRGDRLSGSALDALADYLSQLHGAFIDAGIADLKETFANRSMRRLNHEHIFRLPFDRDARLDLDAITPGLTDAAERLRSDEQLILAASYLGAIYLDDGPALLHGDFFPGSWLQTEAGMRVIDPEFCFFGPPEFDLGVMIAHLKLSEQPPELIERLLAQYFPAVDPDRRLVFNFAGAEIIRRLIGVAQLPLACGLERKSALLELARGWMLN